MAAGAGMWIEAVAGTLLGLAVVDGMERLERILPSGKASVSTVRVERELRQKNAGLRTHALVGPGAALFLQVSAYPDQPGQDDREPEPPHEQQLGIRMQHGVLIV